MKPNDAKSPIGLQIIGAFKLLTAVLIAGLGFGLFHHDNFGAADQVRHIVRDLKLDPDNHYVHSAVERISGVTPRQLGLLKFGTMFYTLLYLTEGIGLLMRKHWAEYFTVIATGSLIPVEVYEVWRRHTPVRIAALAINVAIVVYLIVQLRRGRAGAQAAPAADTPLVT